LVARGSDRGCSCGVADELVDPSDTNVDALIEECEQFGFFCYESCCPEGTRVDSSDVTQCIPEPGTVPEIVFFGPWSESGEQLPRFFGIEYFAHGAAGCTLEGTVGTTSIAHDDTCEIGDVSGDGCSPGYGSFQLNGLDSDSTVHEEAMDLTLTCGNAAGSVSRTYTIAAADERVVVNGAEVCWQVLPVFASTAPAYSPSGCTVHVCQASVTVSQNTTAPCGFFGGQLDAYVIEPITEIGCLTMDFAPTSAQHVAVACSNINGPQQQVVFTTIP
jgi:hypothetical protein